MSGRSPKVPRASSSPRVGGLVVAAHGRHYLVAPEDGGAMLQCFPRGKRSEVAVGDRVIYEPTSADQGVIVEIGERRNLLYRSDQYKSKLFAANLDQLLIVLATTGAATQWTAWRLNFQPRLGVPWFHLWPGIAVYLPPAFFWWWRGCRRAIAIGRW